MDQIVPGSIADMALQNGGQMIPPALCVMFDVSYSMQDSDGTLKDGSRTSRYAAGVEQLRDLQAEYPGQIVLIDFAQKAEVRPGGMPNEPLGLDTLLVPAMLLARELDTGLMRFVVISDGRPCDGPMALQVAQTFQGQIDTIAIGSECSEEFLRSLAQATGGCYHRDRQGTRLLGQVVRGLLAAPMTTDGAC
ncbi:MAG: VWA domain-containing protein [Candidatus Viridilinea halotolerans]|uniref:VWA domain-containing protein n=1 Tax=Candidatus Viridilinea halotolerans TaxID=2491704 RepID=A0A426TSR4_9CHLR|nr:MAG: VWA domain-containing protein [Candidatus Viridilinea halotolerans]